MKTFRRLLTFARPVKWWVLLSALLGFATIGSSIGLMATSAYIIAMAALHPSIAVLQVSIVGVRFFGISRGIFRYLERYVSHQTTFKLLARLRVWFYSALEPLAPARLAGHHSGDLLSRIIADIGSLENFYVRVLAPPLIALLVGALMIALLAPFSPAPAILTLVFMLSAGIGVPLLTQTLNRGLGKRFVQIRATLNTTLVDTVQGLADLMASGREQTQQTELGLLSRDFASIQNRMASITGLNAALVDLLANWATIGILIIAVPMVERGQLDGVYLALLVLSAMAAFEAVAPLPEAAQHLEANLAAAGRLFELADSPAAIIDLPESSPVPQNRSITIKRLQFRYTNDDLPALNDVSFTLPAGGKLAIVGPSGAGKSTLVNLLLRFWDYETGEIRLGGYDLKSYKQTEVRQMIGVVSQRTHLFSGTIRDNLLLAGPEASQAELVEAAKQAQIHTFIQTLPQGYDTWIGEQGLHLSGGERQRIAIARVLLKDAPILILDEATANLDAVTEQVILNSLYRLMENRTTLTITHRLTGLAAMDEILVLRDGSITERGTHNVLLAKRGIYYQMWKLQHQTDALKILDNAENENG